MQHEQTFGDLGGKAFSLQIPGKLRCRHGAILKSIPRIRDDSTRVLPHPIMSSAYVKTDYSVRSLKSQCIDFGFQASQSPSRARLENSECGTDP